MKMIDQLEEFVRRSFEDGIQHSSVTIDFHNGKWISREYHNRHWTEAVNRIRLNNEVDAYCLYKIATQPDEPAAELVKYLHEEWGHEKLIINDLRESGMDEDDVYATEPFFSTRLLMSYIRSSSEHDGALPNFLWNWLVEWYSDNYNPAVYESAGKALGPDAVAGLLTHQQIDEALDHEQTVGATVVDLVERHGETKARNYLTRYVDLLVMYFDELAQSCSAAQAPRPVVTL